MTVPVVPAEANAVRAHWLGFYGFGKRSKPWEHPLKGQRLRIAGLPIFTTTLLAALRARTSIAQKAEAVMAAMAVHPLDLDTVSRCQFHPYRLGVIAAMHSWSAYQTAKMNTGLMRRTLDLAGLSRDNRRGYVPVSFRSRSARRCRASSKAARGSRPVASRNHAG